MKKVANTLIVLLLGLILCIGTASAADTANWEIDTSNLIQQDDKNYSFAGTALLLPLDITGFEGENITRMVVTVTVEDSEGIDITNTLTYRYTSAVEAMVKGPLAESWNYAMAGADIGEDLEALLINITGLPHAADPYLITLDISYGRGATDSVAADTEISIYVKNWLLNDIIDNTLEDYAEDDKWNYTNPVDVRYIIIPNPNTGTYDSDVPFPTIARYARGYTLENYRFALQLTPENSTITVTKSNDKTTWNPVEGATSVTTGVSGNISLTVAEADSNADWLKISFVGLCSGNVTDVDDGTPIAAITDIDYILLTSVTKIGDVYRGPVTPDRYIYGDWDSDGTLSLNDGMQFFNYLQGY